MLANPVPWPGGARCAVAITFDMDADSILHYEFPETAPNRVSTLSWLQYGPEVAIPRILESYRRLELKQTFFVPAWCAEQYPAAVEAIVEDGHELANHGYIHEHPNELPPMRSVTGSGAATKYCSDSAAKNRLAGVPRSTISRGIPPIYWPRKDSSTIPH